MTQQASAARGSADAELALAPDAFARYDLALGRRAAVDGSHLLRLAADSADPGRLVDVEVTGQRLSAASARAADGA